MKNIEIVKPNKSLQFIGFDSLDIDRLSKVLEKMNINLIDDELRTLDLNDLSFLIVSNKEFRDNFISSFKELYPNLKDELINTLDLSLKNGSSYLGTINGDNTAKTINITLDSSSTLTLTGDSYITSLNNDVSDNSNINLNGHTLYVNGTAITSTNYKGATVIINDNNDIANTENTAQDSFDYKIIVLPIVVAIVIICVILVYSKIAKKNNK